LDCLLKYIPKHLHTNEKSIIEEFVIGEELFYRCKYEECNKPYDKISLCDISHNRNFADSDTYKRKDVLFNLNSEDANETYSDLNIAILKIKNLTDKKTYIKKIISESNENIVVTIILKHDPLPCMYPHSIFEISIDKTVVTKENYKKLLGRGGKAYKNIRRDIRQELTSLIQSGIVDDSLEVEILDEP